MFDSAADEDREDPAVLPEAPGLTEYKDQFDTSAIGKLPVVYHMGLDDTVHPTVCAPRRVPLAMKDKIVAELHRMTRLRVISHAEEMEEYEVMVVDVLSSHRVEELKRETLADPLCRRLAERYYMQQLHQGQPGLEATKRRARETNQLGHWLHCELGTVRMQTKRGHDRLATVLGTAPQPNSYRVKAGDNICEEQTPPTPDT
ncbi:unnamed protein product [Boreogadus saida]